MAIKEFTAPGRIIIDEDETLYSLLPDRIARTGEDTPIVSRKTGPGAWDTLTAGEFLAQVRSAAKGLIAFGVNKGDAVTLFSPTRWEWGVLDLAIAAIGAVNVPIYDTDSASQAQRIITDSNVVLAIADNQQRFNRLHGVQDACPTLRQILMLDAHALGALEGLGVSVSDEQLDARIAQVKASDLATIVYTSGSTGAPKGVELTHRNFLSVVKAGWKALPAMLAGDDPAPRLLLFLPLAHCFARYIQYVSIGSDHGVAGYLPDTKTLLADVRAFGPTYMLGVPRVYEKVYNAATRRAGMGLKGRLFARAAEAARDWARTEQLGEPHTARQITEHAMYETLVYRTVRGALGPNIRFLASGGAPLSEDLALFFTGIGLTMIQGYGMTETAAPFSVTRVENNKIGSVGITAPGFSVRIADDGEVLVKGDNVFRGYHNLPEKTAEAFDPDGWLRTGDLGRLDDDGTLWITGRKKDIIITAGGKNVSPIPLEEEIGKCPLVSHAVVVGDRRPFVSALVTLDEEALPAWLKAHNLDPSMPLAQAAEEPLVHAEIQQYVDKANATVSRAESVRKFIVLDEDLSQDNGCMTPSLKVVRPAVNKRYAELLDTKMYAGK